MDFKTKRLLKKAQTGDSVAFATLFQSHAEMLWKQACKVLRSEEDSADALQDAAIKAWQAIPNFDGRCKIQTWLTRILLNCCYDILRSRKTELVVDVEKELASDYNNADYSAKSSAYSRASINSVEHNESQLVNIYINETLDKLSESDKQIITLFYFADMTTRQISDALEITEQAARVRLSRARERFRQYYLEE